MTPEIARLAEATLDALEARFGSTEGDDRPLVLLPGDPELPAPAGDVTRPAPPALACICPTCRLVQPWSARCRSCGQAGPYPSGHPRMGSLLGRPSMLPWRRKRAGVDPFALLGGHATTGARVRGVVAPARATTTSHLTHQVCVVSGLLAGNSPTDVILRFMREEAFLVVSEDNQATLVVGELLLVTETQHELPTSFAHEVLAHNFRDDGIPTWMTRLGLRAPSWHEEPLYSVFETCVRQGDEVEVAGVVTRQFVPEAPGLRDVVLPVVRGVAGAPAVVTVVRRRSNVRDDHPR